jgi:hypothetical protein
VDWTLFSNTEQLSAAAIVGMATLTVLAILFGITRRAAGLALLASVGVLLLYPGGTVAFVSDVTAPLTSLGGDTATRRDGRNAAIDAAVEGRPAVCRPR